MNNSGNDIQLELRKFVAPEFIFGTDARKTSGNYCKHLAAKKVLLVTDPGIMATPWLEEIKTSLFESGIEFELFSSVSPNPRDFEVMEGANIYTSKKCNLILALGGGSVMDCAKGIGIVSTNKKSIEFYEGVDKIANPMPPLVCIPTTSGTAADLSQFAIINKYSERYKMAIISKATVPDVALIDPVVLTTMSPFLTACTGIDALTHAIEAFVSNASSSFTDLWAIESVRLIHDNLMPAILNPANIQYRGKVMLASMYAGLAFSNASLGCVHAMAHSLGGYLDLPHGECNAILLPHVVNFNFGHAPEKYSQLARIFGVNTDNLPLIKIQSEFVKRLIDFKNEAGIHSTLSTKGVKNDSLDILAGKAIKDPCNATNPRVPRKDDLKAIYCEAL